MHSGVSGRTLPGGMGEAARLGKYTLLRSLGTGGMGELFLARHDGPEGFSKKVAVKRLLPHLAQDLTFVDMFLNEARLAAHLSHPNVVQIFELGQEADTYFIAMEYLDGKSLGALHARLRTQALRFPEPIAARICADALRGLEYAHTFSDESGRLLKIVHRDISPDNLLVAFSGVTKVVDFGIAKAVNAVSGTQTGIRKGKASYMAPEQILGGAVDGRADVYSMGVVLYELLTGTRPITGDSPASLADKVLREKPRPPCELTEGVSPVLSEIAMSALAKTPGDRFQAAKEMAGELERFLLARGQVVSQGEVSELMTRHFDREETEVALGERAGRTVDFPGKSATVAQAPLPPGEKTELVTHLSRGEWNPATRAPRKVPALATGFVFGLAVIGGAAALALRARPPAPRLEEPQAAPATQPPLAPPTQAPPPRLLPPEPRRTSTTTRAGKRAGKVILRANPWAEVFFRGKSLGVTPVAPIELPPGSYVFTLKNADLAVERQVKARVVEGEESVLKVDLFAE